MGCPGAVREEINVKHMAQPRYLFTIVYGKMQETLLKYEGGEVLCVAGPECWRAAFYAGYIAALEAALRVLEELPEDENTTPLRSTLEELKAGAARELGNMALDEAALLASLFKKVALKRGEPPEEA